MSYREHAPPAALTPWVQCLWDRRSDGSATRVLPDGCIDLVWTERRGAVIVGPNTTAFVVSNPPSAKVAGARLRPGAAPALLGVASPALVDARVPATELWGDSGSRLDMVLEERDDPVAVIAAALCARLPGARPPDPVVGATVGWLQSGHSVHAIASRVGFSERQLRRRVLSAVGYGPKRLGRVLRLRYALRSAGGGGDLARVALEAGYADQAHFAHECRQLGGLPPSMLIAR